MSTRQDLRVGYVAYELFHTYWAICLHGVKTRAEELGIALALPSASADEDIGAAVADIIGQRIDAVILPGNLAVQPYSFSAFEDAGIPIVVAELGPEPAYACAVHTNELQGADAVVDYLASQIDGHGKVAQFGGGRTRRYDALYRLLERQPRIELAFEALGRWARDDGARMMREALAAHPDLRGIFAHNDQLALGAIDAIEEQGLGGQIVVVGFDGTPEGLAAVHQGRLAATVHRSTYVVGRTCVDMAARAARGEQLPREVQTDVALIMPTNIVEAALEAMSLLPRILHDLIESNTAQARLQQEIIAAQRSMIRELSTPIIPISDEILVLPLIGAIDSARAQQIMETMLETISSHQAAVLIIDITGVAMVDTGVAHYLLQAARAAQLLGARVMLVGISPEVAQTVVQLGVDLSSLPTYSSLQFGLEHARKQVY